MFLHLLVAHALQRILCHTLYGSLQQSPQNERDVYWVVSRAPSIYTSHHADIFPVPITIPLSIFRRLHLLPPTSK